MTFVYGLTFQVELDGNLIELTNSLIPKGKQKGDKGKLSTTVSSEMTPKILPGFLSLP